MRGLVYILSFALAIGFIGSTQSKAAALCATPGNIVANCGFETGTLSSWTLSGDTTGAGVDTFDAHTGTFGAFLAGFGSPAAGQKNYSDLSQILTTIPNFNYELQYYTAYTPGAVVRPDNIFYVQLAGVNIASSTQTNVLSEPWSLHTLLFTPSTSTTRLDFVAEDKNFFFSLDDVHVVAIPEPATLLLLMTSLAGAVLLSRRRAS